MRTCSVMSAVLLSLLAVPMLVGSIILNGFTTIVLTDTTFVGNLSPQRLQTYVIEALPALLNSAVANPSDSESDDVYNALFSDPTLRNIAREQMPAIIAHMNGDLSTAGLSSAIDSEVPALMQQVVAAAPPCTDAQARELDAIMRTARDLGDGLCLPQDAEQEQRVVEYLSTQMRSALTGDALTNNPENPLTSMQMRDVNDAIATITQSARQGIVWPAVLVVIIMALAVRTLRGFFGWLGGLSLATGSVGMAVALLSKSLLSIDLAATLKQNMADQYQIIAPFLTIFDVPVFATYVAWQSTIFGACMIAGGIGVMIAIVLGVRRQHDNRVLAPLPGTPQAHTPGNDGTTAPVAVELDTNPIPIGKVTGPLTSSGTAATTDAHQFAADTQRNTTSELNTSELNTSEIATDDPPPPPTSVGGDRQGG